MGLRLIFCVWLALPTSTIARAENPPDLLAAPAHQAEQKKIDEVLDRWAAWNASVKTFECRVKRWHYDYVFGSPNVPRTVDLGRIWYLAPDYLVVRFEATETHGKVVPMEPQRVEHLILRRNTVGEYRAHRKELIEYCLPAEWDMKRIVDGPLSFIFTATLLERYLAGDGYAQPLPFAATAEELKRTNELRLVTPAERKGEIWLQAVPRGSPRSKWIGSRQLILRGVDAQPIALQVVAANNRATTNYQFFEMKQSNFNDGKFPAEVFWPELPSDWKKIDHLIGK